MLNKIIVVGFLIMLTVPSCLFIAGYGYEPVMKLEAREKMPVIHSPLEIFQKSEQWDKFLTFKMPGKGIYLKQLFQFRRTLGHHPTQMIIHGRHDWLFTNRANIKQHASSSLPFANDHLNDWRTLLNKTNTYFSSQHIDFYVVIAPNKHSVYQNFLPKHLQPYFDYKNVPAAVEYITQDVSFINLFTSLRTAAQKSEVNLYHPFGTHWNAHGGYLAHQTIAEELKMKFPFIESASLTPSQIIAGEKEDNGNAAQLYIEIDESISTKEDGVAPCRIVKDSLIRKVSDFFPQKNTRLVTSGNKGPRIVIIGDSFTEFNAQFYPCSFSEILFVHHQDGAWDKESVDAFYPDVILFEFVERYIDREFTDIFAE